MTLLRSILFLVAFTISGSAATYYVDYAAGSDAYAGTTTGTAWKHCPGDANATGTAAGTTPAAGDTIAFKGGVTYRGKVTLGASGASGNPIVIDGGLWGTGKAIVSGFTNIAGSWTQAASAAEVNGNANYTNIYSIPFTNTSFTPLTAMRLNGVLLIESCLPAVTNPAHAFSPAFKGGTVAVADGAPLTKTNWVDAAMFDQTAGDYWTNTWLSIIAVGNSISVSRVTNFNAATDTISFYLGGTVPTGDVGYMFWNNPAWMTEGSYSIDFAANRIWVWQAGGGSPTGDLEIPSLPQSFYMSGRSFVTYRNLILEGVWGDFGAGYLEGSGIVAYSGSMTRDITISNVDLRHFAAYTSAGCAGIAGINSSNMVVQSCSISNCIGTPGISIGGRDAVVRSNSVVSTGRTGIYFGAVTNGIIEANLIVDLLGVHANGISAYSSCRNVSITRNRITSTALPITVEYFDDGLIANNFVTNGVGVAATISDWGGSGSGNVMANNTLLGGLTSNDGAVFLAATSAASWGITNNIMNGCDWDGAGHDYNIMLSLFFTQSADEFSPNDSTNTFANLFADAGGHLKEGSPAIGAALAMTGLFTVDAANLTRGATWDIGAYEFAPYIAPTTNLVISGSSTIRNLSRK